MSLERPFFREEKDLSMAVGKQVTVFEECNELIDQKKKVE